MKRDACDPKKIVVEEPTRSSADEAVPRRAIAGMLGSLGLLALSGCEKVTPDPDGITGTVASAATGASFRWMDTIGTAASPGDLRNNAGSGAVRVVIVKGFWAAGDGGGGIFFWIPGASDDDGGTKIPAAGGYWQRLFIESVVDIRWFGAKMNDATAGAANSTVMAQVQDVIVNGDFAWGLRIFVPPGALHLGNDLHIYRSIELYGTGIQGESRIVLAKEKSVIVDPATNAVPNHTGTECVIRDLQILSSEEYTMAQGDPFVPADFDPPGYEGKSRGTPGIVVNAPATIERVFIRGFTGTAIFVFAVGESKVNQWRIHDVYINMCGGHGIHVEGGETQGGLCSGVKAISIGGTGFFESSAGGNTYVGCYAEEVKGRGYSCDTVGQASFVGCFAEAGAPTRLVSGVWFGGNTGPLTEDTVGFVALSVVDFRPFNINNMKGTSVITTNVGVNDTNQAALGWQTSDDPTWFWQRWSRDQQAWIVDRHPSPNPATYITGSTENAGGSIHPRGASVQGFPWLLLGSNPTGPDTLKPAIRMTTGVGIPETWHPDGDVWHVGDRVFNAKPMPGDADGWVCVAGGPPGTAEWRSFGTIALM